MNRERAIRKLYAQYRTERDFGWYASDPAWRAELREVYPVDYVAAHHRDGVTPSMINENARRVMALNRRISH